MILSPPRKNKVKDNVSQKKKVNLSVSILLLGILLSGCIAPLTKQENKNFNNYYEQQKQYEEEYHYIPKGK
jgi:hypothetical protein